MNRSPNLKRQFNNKMISFRTCESNAKLLELMAKETGLSKTDILLAGLALFKDSREYDMLVENRRQR